MIISTVLLLPVLYLVSATPTPTVQAPWGTIQGVMVKGDGGREMEGYYGIPYAVPPVGDLRLEKPQPHPGPGQGQLFVADHITPACLQTHVGLLEKWTETSEDCLTLNVYRNPPADKDPQRPVMIYIHGGSYGMGEASSYRPSKLVVDGQVVVVIIQYRLGPLGFLSSGDDVLLGNLGLWDQNLAIRWVKDNIRAFGGDPDTMTIFGESAGSMSLGLQHLSPHSKGLFQRAIFQSGSPTLLMTTSAQNGYMFREVAKLLDCQRDTNREILSCLKQVPAEDFFTKTGKFCAQSAIGNMFFPTIDGDFVPDDPRQLMQDEQYMQKNRLNDVDVLMGFNNQEGAVSLLFLSDAKLPEDLIYNAEFFYYLVDQCFSMNGRLSASILSEIVDFFYRGANVGTYKPVSTDEVTNLYGDCVMNAPTVEWMRYLASQSSASSSSSRYLYVLDHKFSFHSKSKIPGSYHGEELQLLFDQLLNPEMSLVKFFNWTELESEEQTLSDQFVHIIAEFAKTGDLSNTVGNAQGGDWPQFTNENEAYLSISRSPRVVTNLGPYRDRVALWLYLVPELTAWMSPRQENGTGNEEELSTKKDEL